MKHLEHCKSDDTNGGGGGGGGNRGGGGGANEEEEEEEREVDMMDQAEKIRLGLGVTKDAIGVARKASALGFSAASTGTQIGFSIGRTVLSIPKTVANFFVGERNPVSLGIDAADMVVSAAEAITIGSISASGAATAFSLDATASGLALAGARDGDGWQLLIDKVPLDLGGEEISAMANIIQMVMTFTNHEFPGTVTLSDVHEGIRAFSALQERCNEALPDASSAVDITYLDNRYMHFSAAAYGALAGKFLGILPLTFDDTAWQAAATCARGKQSGQQLDRDNIAALCTLVPGVKGSDVVLWESSSDVYRPGYFVALDHDQKAVVVCLRGTYRVQDALTDLICEAERVDGTAAATAAAAEVNYAHKGMLLSARHVGEALSEVVSTQLIQHSGYKLVVTGHSLGAGVAALLTMLWVNAGNALPFLAHHIHCYAYACPCVMSANLARIMQPYISSFVLDDDMVPRFGIATSEDLRSAILRIVTEENHSNSASLPSRILKAAHEIDSLSQKISAMEKIVSDKASPPVLSGILSIATQEEGDDITAAVLQAEAEEERSALVGKLRTILHHIRTEEMTAEKLYPAGQVCHIQVHQDTVGGCRSSVDTCDVDFPKMPCDTPQASFRTRAGVRRNNTFFSELRLSKNMFWTHMPQNYLVAVRQQRSETIRKQANTYTKAPAQVGTGAEIAEEKKIHLGSLL